jgi:hypothetical protein
MQGRIDLMKHRYFALSMCFVLLTAFVAGCFKGDQRPPGDLVAKNEGKYVLYIVSGSDSFDYEVNQVVNADNVFLNAIEQVVIHRTEEEKKMWQKLGVKEFPMALFLDTKKIVFQTNDPTKIKAFAKSLEGK